MVAASPSPRRVKAPSWLDLRLVLGALLVLASVLAGACRISEAARTDSGMAVTRDLSVGTILHPEDIRLVSVRLGGDELNRYLDADAEVTGRQLTRAVAKGELLPATTLRAAPPLTTVTVPLATGQALGWRARSSLAQHQACPSVVLLADATVQGVQAADATALSVDAGQDVTLSLPRIRRTGWWAHWPSRTRRFAAGCCPGLRRQAPCRLTGCTRTSTP